VGTGRRRRGEDAPARKPTHQQDRLAVLAQKSEGERCGRARKQVKQLPPRTEIIATRRLPMIRRSNSFRQVPGGRRRKIG
jgi:hypothetical protein